MDILTQIVGAILGFIFIIFVVFLLSCLSNLPRVIKDLLEPNEGFFKYGKVELFLTDKDYDYLIDKGGLSKFLEGKKDTLLNRRKLRLKFTSVLQGIGLTSPEWIASRYKFHYKYEEATDILSEFLDKFSKYKKHVSPTDPIGNYVGPWGREQPYGLLYFFQFKTTSIEIDLRNITDFYGTTKDWFIIYADGAYYHYKDGFMYVHLDGGEECLNAE